MPKKKDGLHQKKWTNLPRRPRYTKLIHNITSIPRDVIRKRVHDGSSTRFWLDPWQEGEILALRYPRLFALELNKNAYVSEKLSGPSYSWNWRRMIRPGREQQVFENMVTSIGNFKLSNGIDVWIWNYRGEKQFQVSNFRHALDSFMLPSDNFTTYWNKWIPKKVNIFTWRLFRDRLPSRINLALRRVPNVSLSCPICFSGLDTLEHTFNTCRIASGSRNYLSRWLQLTIPESNPSDLRDWVQSIQGPSSYKQLILGILSCWWWLLWKNRNKAAFEQDHDTSLAIFNQMQHIIVSAYNSADTIICCI